MDIIKQCLHLYYGEQNKEEHDKQLASTKLSKKRKVDMDCQDGDSKKMYLQKDHEPEVSDESEVGDGHSSQGANSEEGNSSKTSFEPPDNLLSRHISDPKPRVSGESEVSGGYVSQSANSEEENPSKITSKPPNNLLSRHLSEQEIDNSFIKFCLGKNENEQEINKLLNFDKTPVGTMSDKICDNVKSLKASKQDFENISREGSNLSVKPKHLSSFFMNDHKNRNITQCGTPEINKGSKDFFPYLENCSPLSTNSVNYDILNRALATKVEDPVINEDVGSDDILKAEELKSLSENLAGISSPTLSQWSRGELSISHEKKVG